MCRRVSAVSEGWALKRESWGASRVAALRSAVPSAVAVGGAEQDLPGALSVFVRICSVAAEWRSRWSTWIG